MATEEEKKARAKKNRKAARAKELASLNKQSRAAINPFQNNSMKDRNENTRFLANAIRKNQEEEWLD